MNRIRKYRRKPTKYLRRKVMAKLIKRDQLQQQVNRVNLPWISQQERTNWPTIFSMQKFINYITLKT